MTAGTAGTAGPAGTAATTETDLRVVVTPGRPSRIRDARETLRFDGPGLALAAALVCMSLTPSLLPRSPAFQGWLSGIVAAAGYFVGVYAVRLPARLVPWRPGDRLRRAGWWAIAVAGPVAVLWLLLASRKWQREAHELVGRDAPSWYAPLFVVALAISVFLALVAAGRGIRALTAAVAHRLARRLPGVVAAVASVALVLMASWTLLDQVVARAFLAGMDRIASAANEGTRAGVTRPTLPTRTAGPGSLVDWDDLGLQGRTFVSGGPSRARLTEFAGREAADPIRVYVGLNSFRDPSERAAAAVAELERTGAFERSVLCLVTTTGTGWVDPKAAAALEYLWAGDTAIVATQYSYLPSPVSFVFDDDQVEQEGAELYRQVHERWSRLPAGQRPKLLLYGESLGSNGGQVALGSPDDLGGRVDGALFAGPPSSNRLWQDLVRHREPGSPQRLPAYRDGSVVRFAAEPGDLDGGSPRVVFLQHATDPVVWWEPELLWQRPDWLSEPHGADVPGSMSWYPVVTFWQVTADLVAANDVPPGVGHRYGALIADGWAAVARPPGWTASDTARLRGVL